MENSEFEWDYEKAKNNFKKHDVSFDEPWPYLMILKFPQFLTQTILKMKNVMCQYEND